MVLPRSLAARLFQPLFIPVGRFDKDSGMDKTDGGTVL